MTEPLVTIALSDYNTLIAKKDIFETLWEIIKTCGTLDEAKDKLESPTYSLQLSNENLMDVKFSVTLKQKEDVPTNPR